MSSSLPCRVVDDSSVGPIEGGAGNSNEESDPGGDPGWRWREKRSEPCLRWP